MKSFCRIITAQLSVEGDSSALIIPDNMQACLQLQLGRRPVRSPGGDAVGNIFVHVHTWAVHRLLQSKLM